MVAGPSRAAALREAPAPNQDNQDRPKSIACSAFLDHWISIRGRQLVPTLSRFCETAAATFAPASSIVELQDNLAIVRFQGAALLQRWGRDMTGSDLYDTFSYYYRVRALSNIGKVAAFPCGYFGLNRLILPDGARVASHFIQMPLVSGDGSATYIVHFASAEPVDDPAHGGASYYRTQSAAWIDVGAGVPPKPPHLLNLMKAVRR
jgi:hypothetical protein